MKEEELKAIEARSTRALTRTTDIKAALGLLREGDRTLLSAYDVPALVAEVRRLRSLLLDCKQYDLDEGPCWNPAPCVGEQDELCLRIRAALGL